MANRYLHAKHVDQGVVRPFVPADALGVVNLLYKTYGFTYRGLDAPGPGRRETFLFGTMFSERRRAPVWLPPRHASAIREIYALHGLERDAEDPARGPKLEAASTLEIDVVEGWLSARIDV